MSSLTLTISDRTTSCIALSRGSAAVRSSWDVLILNERGYLIIQFEFDGDDRNLMDAVRRDNMIPFSIFLGKLVVLGRSREYRESGLRFSTADGIRSC